MRHSQEKLKVRLETQEASKQLFKVQSPPLISVTQQSRHPNSQREPLPRRVSPTVPLLLSNLRIHQTALQRQRLTTYKSLRLNLPTMRWMPQSSRTVRPRTLTVQ